MWDDLSKISIALHKSGVPPRPRLNWTLACLEILEQKRGTLITVVTPFVAGVALSPSENGENTAESCIQDELMPVSCSVNPRYNQGHHKINALCFTN